MPSCCGASTSPPNQAPAPSWSARGIGHGYDDEHGIYGKAGILCTRCGEIVRSSTIAGRSSHWCPGCQKPQRLR
ncbi:zinc finger domain-containing protein [Brevibacterium sp. HMSC24B04]|uniref:zinc finger domain-containing protein n=1 Tax=Brevibacterium sp. HMSC24B04 TaxID=1581060 RepID=UPI0009F16753|nr:zinc finger domain-containing protein [Brevibacterium sp. HMSC24B04]